VAAQIVDRSMNGVTRPTFRRPEERSGSCNTPVDLIVVDEINRLPIGRPWVTIVFDVASRTVLGFHATPEAPSATSVAMALSMACLPKSKWLKSVRKCSFVALANCTL
jgi:transposase InsO family protein